jgi:hypothetical protein
MSRYNITQKSALLRAALVAVLLAALPSVHASLHEASVELQDFLHKIQPSAPQTSSRKLLGGADCLQYVSASADIYVGTCGALATKSEDHWCDISTVLNSCDASNNYCGAGYTIYNSAVYVANGYGITSGAACVGTSEDDCCKINDGAVAGLVIGVIAGAALIIAAFAYCCKCCCFRPKPVIVMAAQQPQIVVVPAGTK